MTRAEINAAWRETISQLIAAAMAPPEFYLPEARQRLLRLAGLAEQAKELALLTPSDLPPRQIPDLWPDDLTVAGQP